MTAEPLAVRESCPIYRKSLSLKPVHVGASCNLPRPGGKGTKTLARFFALGLIVLPIIEIAIFIKVGQWIGLLPTLALVIGAAIAGGLLIRQQGLSVLGQLRGNIDAGRLPGRTIADAMMIGLAAILLVLPGFLTDVVALALLLPPVRGFIYAALARRVTVVHATPDGAWQRPGDPRLRRPGTIDLDDDDYRPR
jgi:UPF0716 protein FxsA